MAAGDSLVALLYLFPRVVHDWAWCDNLKYCHALLSSYVWVNATIQEM